MKRESQLFRSGRVEFADSRTPGRVASWEADVFTHSRKTSGHPVSGMVFVVVAMLAIAVPFSPASAQGHGVFTSLFGSPRPAMPPSITAYADPNSQVSPFGIKPAEPAPPPVASSPSVSYCVRLCDGRFFPIQRATGADPAEACNSFCPASRTKIYSGSGIDNAVANDGTRYAKLATAFVYRDRTVAGCTCNGRNAFGLVTTTTTAADDPTLRPGDIVASEQGFVAYAGGKRQNAEFTPITNSSVASELRQKLARAKIVPRNATPVPTPEQFAAMRTATDDGASADRKRASRRATAQR